MICDSAQNHWQPHFSGSLGMCFSVTLVLAQVPGWGLLVGANVDRYLHYLGISPFMIGNEQSLHTFLDHNRTVLKFPAFIQSLYCYQPQARPQHAELLQLWPRKPRIAPIYIP